MPDLAPIDQVEHNPDHRWLLVTRGNMFGMLPVHVGVLPISPWRRTDWSMLLDDAVEVLAAWTEDPPPGAPPPTEPVQRGGSYTLRDAELPVEKLTEGHFKPEKTPLGRRVEVCRLVLADAPHI